MLAETLKSIEALRVITKNSDYEKGKYAHLVEAYNQLAGPYKASISLPTPPKASGFFAGLYQDTKKFFSDLNKYRKNYGMGWAVVEFFAKSWQIAKPFLGGAGIGLTLGAAMQATRDKHRQLEDKEKRLNQKKEELKKKEVELKRREQLLAAAEKETASASKEEKHASDSDIHKALNAETTKLFGGASQVIPKNEAEFAGPDKKKKPTGS